MEDPRVKVRAVVVVLAAEERLVEARESMRLETGVTTGTSAEGRTTPVRAWKISATGGSASSQGTVKRGLSQRLCVLGSS
jgi:hypothetical protein